MRMRRAILTLTILLLSGCSVSGNDCDKLVKFVCKDERFSKIIQYKGSRPLGYLDLYILDKAIEKGGNGEIYDAIKGTNDDCTLTERLVKVSHEGTSPFIRNLAEESCTEANAYLSSLLQLIPDR